MSLTLLDKKFDLVSTEANFSSMPTSLIIDLSWIEKILEKIANPNIKLLDLSSGISGIWPYLERKWLCKSFMLDPSYWGIERLVQSALVEPFISSTTIFDKKLAPEVYKTQSEFRAIFLNTILNQKIPSNWSYIAGWSENLPFVWGCMDVVFVSTYLSILWNNDKSRWKDIFFRTINEIYRVLWDNWKIVITDYYSANWLAWIIWKDLMYMWDMKILHKANIISSFPVSCFSIQFTKEWFEKLIRGLKSIL